MNKMKHWYFSVSNWDGETFYLDADGREIDDETARSYPWMGVHDAALFEAGRRADLWQALAKEDAATVVAHAAGKAR